MGSEGGSATRGYFEAIEEEFIRLRGAPLLLSPADWRLAQRWRRQGVPQHLVLEAIREVFARRAEREALNPEGAKRRVSSLRYCRAAVEKAWLQHRELGAASVVRPSTESIDVTARLAALADALPAEIENAGRWRGRLLELEGSAPEVEQRLVELDGELVSHALAALPGEDREALQARAEEVLAGMRGRIDPERQTDLRRRLVQRFVRERCGLPLLSLFAEPQAARPGK